MEISDIIMEMFTLGTAIGLNTVCDKRRLKTADLQNPDLQTADLQTCRLADSINWHTRRFADLHFL